VSGSGASSGVHRIDAAELDEQTALVRRLLGRPRIVYRSRAGRAELALTFDDGPSRWTAEIAATLEQHGCHGTFFVRGSAIEARPHDLVALAKAGHELGNHLWSHSDPAAQSRAEIRAEIEQTASAIDAVTGQRPHLVRPPYCRAPKAVAGAARRTGVKTIVQRSIGAADWQAKSSEEVFGPVLECVEAGDIVCLHDGISSDKRDSDSREATVEAVKRLVPALLERGLRPVTVSELLT
jgi:peptidoglycan/xylan/chitin deacetylase (PgdA/CDA1 family)